MQRNLFLCLILFPVALFGQQNQMGNWMMYFGMNKVSDNFSIHSEMQYRNHTIAPINIDQLLLRTGLNYHFSDNSFATAGYAYIQTYAVESEENSPEVNEHRIWQQLILNNQIGRIKFEHRYRIEQRWVNQDYKNRFRYRLMLFVPINKPKIEKGSFFVGLYDEIFINGRNDFFDRNRFYAALGYQFNKATNAQVGMLHQRVKDFGKWNLQFALVYNPDFRNNGVLK